jgi:hypothetical protein
MDLAALFLLLVVADDVVSGYGYGWTTRTPKIITKRFQ